MKFHFIFWLCFVISLPLMSQSKFVNCRVSGQIVEKLSGKSIPYATVTLKNDSTKEKIAQASDASGRFSLKAGKSHKYILVISSIGYREVKMPINITEELTNLGTLTMEEGVELKTVTITAQKPLVKVDVDKIVYSVESDPESQTSNTLEILRKIPLVTVDAEDNITLKGQSNFKVLVNGKSSSMMSNNLKDVLKSLPANTIKDIEVITNPSSKYDAEGVGGIINIITTKKTISGYNGSISAGMDSHGSYNGSLYLATKINKFSFSTRYFVSQFKQPGAETNSNGEYFNNTSYHYLNSNGTSDYKGLFNGFSGEASYEIDSLDLISLSFWGNNGSYKSDNYNETKYYNTDKNVTRWYQNNYDSKNSWGSLSGNIDYQKTYKKPDKSLTFSYKLDNNPNTTNSTSDITGLSNYPSYQQRSHNNANGREQTVQVDYYDPLTKMHQIEGGMKFILRQNTSNSDTYRDDTLRVNYGNDLDYDQYILGAYAGYVFKWKKISTKTGLRLERTWNDGDSKANGNDYTFKNRLFNLVPYITIAFMPKEGQTIKASYTQRLSRPGIWYLNPYVNNVDSMNISYGNPSLDAEVAHSFEMGYDIFTQKFNFSVSSSASFINNSIESISKVQSNGATVTTYENIGKNQNYGLNVYSSYRAGVKFNVYFNGGANYSKFKANNGYSITNEGFNYRGSLGGKLTLWKDAAINANGGIYSPNIMLQGKSSSFFYTGLGLSQYLLDRKLMLSFSARDPFWKHKKFTNESSDQTFYTHYETTRLAQTFRFNITYNFGKMNLEVKKAKRGIQNDDLKSGGSSQGDSNQ